jgi:hypothetical protein
LEKRCGTIQALNDRDDINIKYQLQDYKKDTMNNAIIGPRAFQSKEELKRALRKYCAAHNVDDIARTYGYPIDKWDVSQLQDMSGLFVGMERFDEYIGS